MLPETLSSDRLVLSMPGETDLDLVTEYCNDPEFERFLPLPFPYRRSDAESFVLEYVPAAWADDSEYTWAVRDDDTGPLLGMIGWRRRGDLGFWMGAPHRGRGYMTEATIIVCEWVFGSEPDVDEIRWEATVGNLASAHVAQRAGFRFGGVAPLGHRDRDGVRSPGWHAVLGRDDSRDLKDGWPL
jgi:RimJ/RimL family protein N-acetyltransferase